MKNIFERVIEKGGYDLPAMLERIHEYHVAGQLTRQQRDELTDMARRNATAAAGMDIPGEIQRLCQAVRSLQQALESLHRRLQALEGGDHMEESDTAVSVPAEYAQPTGAHDAYFAGDRVVYAGVIYTCVAPAGVACVWSPATMPDYWRAESGDV